MWCALFFKLRFKKLTIFLTLVLLSTSRLTIPRYTLWPLIKVKKKMTNLLKHLIERDYSFMKKPLNDKRFANNCFKTGPLHPKILQLSHSTSIWAIELSKDESFLVIGGAHQEKENVVTWKIGDAFGDLKSTVVHSDRYYDESANLISCGSSAQTMVESSAAAWVNESSLTAFKGIRDW